jgi:hypothetical protein
MALKTLSEPERSRALCSHRDRIRKLSYHIMLSKSDLYALEDDKIILEERRAVNAGRARGCKPPITRPKRWSSTELCRVAHKVIRIRNERSKPDG